MAAQPDEADVTVVAFECSRLLSLDGKRSRLLLYACIESGGSCCAVPSSDGARDPIFNATLFLRGPASSGSGQQLQPIVLFARICDLSGNDCAVRLDLSALLNASSAPSRHVDRYFILKTPNGTPAGQLHLSISALSGPRRLHVPADATAEDALTAGFDAEGHGKEPDADSEPEFDADTSFAEEDGGVLEPPTAVRTASLTPIEGLALAREHSAGLGEGGAPAGQAAGRVPLVHCDSFAAMLARGRAPAAVPFPQFSSTEVEAVPEAPSSPPPGSDEGEEGLLEPGESLETGSSPPLRRSSAAPSSEAAEEAQVPPAQHGGDERRSSGRSARSLTASGPSSPGAAPLEDEPEAGRSPPHVPHPQFQAALDVDA